MKKLTQFVGVFATVLISASTLAGCSSTPDDPGTPMTTAGTGGTGGGGASGAGMGGSTLLMPPNTYTILTAAEAVPGAMPAPPAWEAKGCKTCHGVNGEGVTSIGPEIRHTPTVYATHIVRNGRAPFIMAAFPETPMDKKIDVSAADLTAILTWLNSQPKPTTPQGLYKDFCGNCHGPKVATGGAVAVSIIGKTKMEVGQKVRAGEGLDPAIRDSYMPAEDAASLSDVELVMIEEYLMSK